MWDRWSFEQDQIALYGRLVLGQVYWAKIRRALGLGNLGLIALLCFRSPTDTRVRFFSNPAFSQGDQACFLAVTNGAARDTSDQEYGSPGLRRNATRNQGVR